MKSVMEKILNRSWTNSPRKSRLQLDTLDERIVPNSTLLQSPTANFTISQTITSQAAFYTPVQAIDVRVVSGTLYITGTSLDDRVEVTNDSTVTTTNSSQGTRSHNVSGYNRVQFSGGAGNDYFISESLTIPVTAYGDAGDDTLIGSQAPSGDFLVGDAGRDTIQGRIGTDTIWGDGYGQLNGTPPDGAANASNYADTIDGNDDTDYIYGGFGGDVIRGGNQNDFLLGGADGDTLYGDDGDDWLYGGDGNDQLRGGNQNDKLFGDADWDSLFGENGNDWLEAGAAAEPADGGWDTDYNAHIWAINGAQMTDIVQQQGGTCVTLSALAGAARFQDMASRISYLGNFNYSVRLFNPTAGAWQNVNTRFDGTISMNGTERMDPASRVEGEFWTILSQRAYLSRIIGIDPMNGAAVKAFGGENNGRAIQVWTGSGVTDQEINNKIDLIFITIDLGVKPSELGAAARTRVVQAGGTGHRYVVQDVVSDGNGGWNVVLYNPWGTDGSHNSMNIIADGTNDGTITISWATFQSKLKTVWYQN